MKIINKINALKKVLRVSLFILTFICGIALLSDVAFNSNEVNSDDNTPIKVSVSATRSYNNGEAYPLVTNGKCNKTVQVTIKLSRKTTDSISVYYKTIDSTASSTVKAGADKGDYTALDGTVIFSANETSRNITIEVNSEPYAVAFTSNAKNGGWTGRYFYFQIYKVDGQNAEIDETKCEVKCHIAYDYIYSASYVDKIQTLDLLKGTIYTKKHKEYQYGDEAVSSSGNNYYLYNDSIYVQNLQNYIVNKGLGYMYVTGTARVTDFTCWQDDMTYSLVDYNDNKKTLCWIRLDGYLGRLPFCGKPDYWDEIDFGKVGSKAALTGWSYSDRDYEDSGSISGNTSDSNGIVTGHSKVTTYDNKKWFIVESKNTKIGFDMNTSGKYDYRGTEWYNLQYTCLDTMKPYIVSYYCDKEVSLKSGNIQLMIRFSEPVTLTDSSKVVQVRCGLEGMLNNNYLYFNYAGGSGSDTWVFEADLLDDKDNANIQKIITQLCPDRITNAQYICDMSCYHNCLDSYVTNGTESYWEFSRTIPNTQDYSSLKTELNNLKNLNIDPRQPSISSEINSTTKTVKSVSVLFEVTNFSYETGKAYYAWSNDCTLTNDITPETDYIEIKSTSNRYQVQNNSLNGVRFLFIKVVSQLGRVDAKIAGPYYFDNREETASNIQFVDDDGIVNDEIATSPSKDKYITFYIDYSDCYYTATDLASVDMIKCSDANWKVDSTYSLNAGDGHHFWDTGTNVLNEEIALVDSDTTTVNKLKFSVNSIVSEGKVASSYQKSTFNDGNETVTYTTKAYYKLKVAYEHFGIEEPNYEKFYMGILLTDKLGNCKEAGEYDHSSLQVYFDSRNRIGGKWEMINNGTSKIALADPTAIIYNANSSFKFKSTETYTNIDYGIEIVKGDKKITIKETTITIQEGKNDPITRTNSNYNNDYFDITFTGSNTFSFTPKQNFNDIVGYYEITIIIYGETSYDDQYTTPYEFYYVHQDTTKNLTYTDSTTNLSAMEDYKVLINKVYTIALNTRYYYKDSAGTITYETYSTGKPLSFSTEDAASDYLTYMEYQDLSLLYIDSQSIAGSLNNGSSGFVKASGDDAYTAMVGQTWIRYKRSTWTTAGATDSNWVYYYYSEVRKDSITISDLNTTLKNAIDLVVKTIMQDNGSYTYLNSDFGLSKAGAPMLTEAAIKADAESVEHTRSGSLVTNSLNYTGDAGIYSNIITTESLGQYVLASTYELEFTDKTIIYIAKYTGKDLGFTDFVKIQSNDDLMLRDYVKNSTNSLINGSGVYKFIEVDENGAQSYMVYIDTYAPTLHFEYEQKTTTGETVRLSQDTDSTRDEYSFYGTKCTVGVMSNEIDDYSHVTIFNAKTNAVYNTYTREELEKNEGKIVLENGRYSVEVYDRSGNTYVVKVMVNSTEMECEISEKKNSYFTFSIYNRSSVDINSYVIYYNNESIPVASVFSSTNTFKDAGTYTIDVVDWYGNTYHNVYEFKREIPELIWKYKDENGKYVTYDTTKVQDMYITSDGSQVFNIVTSKLVSFYYEGQFKLVIEVDDDAVSYTCNEGSSSFTYNFLELKDFHFRVYYEKYPEVYADYYVKVDSSAPEVKATYSEYIVAHNEFDDVIDQATNAIGVKEGDELIPSSITYAVQQTYDKQISMNSKVSAREIKISFEDDSEVYQIKVALDGKTLVETTEIAESYSFDKYGTYTITATDRLNNTSIFMFTNSEQTDYEYSVDDNVCSTPLSCIDYFNTEYVYTKIEYGNAYAVYKVPNASTISFLIYNNDQKLFFRYNYDGTLVEKMKFVVSYCYDDKQYDADGNVIADYTVQYAEIVEKQVLDTSETLKVNQWYSVATVEEDGVNIFAKVDEDNKLYFKVEASNFDTDVFDLQTKIAPTDKSEPFYSRVGLSKMKSDVELINEDGAIETNHDGESIYVNGTIKIEKDKFNTQIVTKIRGAYSVDNKFNSYTTIYENGEFMPYVLEYEGFYRIIIDNIYGNQTIYNIALSNDCLIVLEMVYYDGTTNSYTSAYESDTFYSNDKAKVDVYSEGITYNVTKDGVEFIPEILLEETHLGITLSGNGTYVVFVQDKFGNNYTKYVEIEYKTVTISNDLLTGFNEKALLRDENYTNKKVSVNQSELEMSSFDYICVTKDGEINNMVLDLLSENKTLLDVDKLTDCIGNSGDGVYKVSFRDKYGNLAYKEITYRETPTLSITRQSRIEINPIDYDLENALTNGVYSNNIVSLLSNSVCYTFTVDGNQSKLPYTFEFENNTITEGQKDFEVYYLDEYGFEYVIKIHLNRTEIQFDEVKFTTVDYNEKKYTQDYVVLTYGDEYTCSYTLDNGESVNYPSGIKCNDDGAYLFTLLDVSGNACYYSVVKDTIVEYAFVGNNTGTEFISSSVVSEETVKFTAKNGDSSKISKVFLDGELQESYDSTQFKEDGKWEFLISDEIGNTAVYTLYIITHSMNHFAYTCPKNYQITDLRYNNGDGQKLDYLNQVVDYKSFEFDQDGDYTVTMMSTINNEVTKFQFTISSAKPTATLEGVEDGSSTIENVTLTGTVKGDVIYIYKDGKLSQTFEVSADGESPEISEKGEYKFVIENLAGNTSEFTFTKKYVANTAGSVLIIVVVVALALSLFVGVVYRNKSKVDK